MYGVIDLDYHAANALMLWALSANLYIAVTYCKSAVCQRWHARLLLSACAEVWGLPDMHLLVSRCVVPVICAALFCSMSTCLLVTIAQRKPTPAQHACTWTVHHSVLAEDCISKSHNTTGGQVCSRWTISEQPCKQVTLCIAKCRKDYSFWNGWSKGH